MTCMFKMTNGTTYHNCSGQYRRPNPIHVQKKQNFWNNRSRWSCITHHHTLPEYSGDQDIIYTVLSLPNSMERGLFKRGITRREYQICLLEARYPCKKWTNITKSTEPTKRKYQNGGCFQTRSVFGDKQASNESYTVDTIESRTKRLCIRNRPVVNDTLRDKVFQGVGSDLIAPWLTPTELHCVKKTFRCDWDWGQSWYGGKVKNKAVAAQVAAFLPRGRTIIHLIDSFGADDVFSALWYILSCSEFIQATFQYGHYKSIRRLDRLK